MLVIILIIFAILFFVLRFSINWNTTLSYFRSGNVIVYGRKRKGKDLLFSAVIHKRRRELGGKHNANIRYNDKTNVISIKDASAGDNTFLNLIEGRYKKFWLSLPEGVDNYFSDCGIFLPSQYHGTLDKYYPTLPVYYALNGHLSASNTHLNTQGLTRVWDKLREQADSYIRILKNIKWLPFYIFIKVRIYEEYEDAKANLALLKEPFFDNRFGKAVRQVENSRRGCIREFWLPIRRKYIEYDTRYFKSVLLLENKDEKTN